MVVEEQWLYSDSLLDNETFHPLSASEVWFSQSLPECLTTRESRNWHSQIFILMLLLFHHNKQEHRSCKDLSVSLTLHFSFSEQNPKIFELLHVRQNMTPQDSSPFLYCGPNVAPVRAGFMELLLCSALLSAHIPLQSVLRNKI